MVLRGLLIAAFACLLLSPAEARHHHRVYVADPGCNVFWPCEGVSLSPRGERIVKSMKGFGSAQKIYSPRSEAIVSHPDGCPRIAFCACGASVEIFGRAIRGLYAAAAWLKFPRTSPSSGMAAIAPGRHHIFVLREHRQGDIWVVYDANSGGHATRVHERSIAGYTIVNPRA